MRLERARCAFTLVELLVVIAIVGVLLALMLPAAQHAREAARKSTCQNHLRQIGLGLHLRHDTWGALPAGWEGYEDHQPEVSAGPGWGWAAAILPYVEQLPLSERIDRTRSILDPINAEARQQRLPLFRCPSDAGPATFDLLSSGGTSLGEFPTANYAANFGVGRVSLCAALAGTGRQCTGEPQNGLFYHNSQVRFADIARKGQSNLIMVGERHSQGEFDQAPAATWVGAVWNGSGDFSRVVGTARHAVTVAGNTSTTRFADFTSRHSGGVYFVYADGHVGLISSHIDHVAFANAMTPQWVVETVHMADEVSASPNDEPSNDSPPGTETPRPRRRPIITCPGCQNPPRRLPRTF
jgi:prepilin-type N-terminal cleavage/methylation domain-containing protein/prepilin-type processing-associated H-X9-DG protein